MSLAGLRKPPNFAGWGRDLVEKVKNTLLSWQDEGGVYAEEHDESDTFQLYDIQGNSLSDLVNQELLSLGDVTSSESSQAEESGGTEAAEERGGSPSETLSLSIVSAENQLWCDLGELAQLVRADRAEVVEGLRQINITLGPANRLPLRCLPALFIKMDVQDEIIAEVTSQIRERSG